MPNLPTIPHLTAWRRAGAQQLVPELKEPARRGRAERVHLVPKNRYSGFYGTDLRGILGFWLPAGKRERVDEVELVGVCTKYLLLLHKREELANRDVPHPKYMLRGSGQLRLRKPNDFALAQK